MYIVRSPPFPETQTTGLVNPSHQSHDSILLQLQSPVSSLQVSRPRISGRNRPPVGKLSLRHSDIASCRTGIDLISASTGSSLRDESYHTGVSHSHSPFMVTGVLVVHIWYIIHCSPGGIQERTCTSGHVKRAADSAFRKCQENSCMEVDSGRLIPRLNRVS